MNHDTNSQMIDETLLQELITLGKDIGEPLLEEMIQKFKMDYPARLREIRTHSLADDFESLDHALHSLKGSVAVLGALRVQAICQHLEQQAREQVKIEACVTREIQQEIMVALAAIEAFLQTSTVMAA